MVVRALFVIGLIFIVIGLASFAISSHLPGSPSGTVIQLIPPPHQGDCRETHGCAGGAISECDGHIATRVCTIADTPPTYLEIEKEWPSQMDINSSDEVRVLLISKTSGPIFEVTPAQSGNHIVTKEVPPLGIFNNFSNSIEENFGPGYEALATANLVATTFDVKAIGLQEQTLRQYLVGWDWNIKPTTLGTQLINVDIEVQWKPIGNGQVRQIQIWRSEIAINVTQSWTDIWQTGVGTLGTNFGTILLGSGLTVPWFVEQIGKWRKEGKNKRNLEYPRGGLSRPIKPRYPRGEPPRRTRREEENKNSRQNTRFDDG